MENEDRSQEIADGLNTVVQGAAIVNSFVANLAIVAGAVQAQMAEGREQTPEEKAAAKAITDAKRALAEAS